jgi:hypothetical protein
MAVTMGTTIEDRLARLESEVRVARDKQEIYDLIMRYCRGVDRADYELLSSVVSPGEAADAKMITDTVFKVSKLTMHFIGNVLIDVDGDKAKSESYFISYHLVDRGGKDFLREKAARYLHRWERRNGQWTMTYRDVVDEWNTMNEVTERSPGAEQWTYGVRSREDPVYKL